MLWCAIFLRELEFRFIPYGNFYNFPKEPVDFSPLIQSKNQEALKTLLCSVQPKQQRASFQLCLSSVKRIAKCSHHFYTLYSLR